MEYSVKTIKLKLFVNSPGLSTKSYTIYTSIVLRLSIIKLNKFSRTKAQPEDVLIILLRQVQKYKLMKKE
jgi:hypothetical protein